MYSRPLINDGFIPAVIPHAIAWPKPVGAKTQQKARKRIVLATTYFCNVLFSPMGCKYRDITEAAYRPRKSNYSPSCGEHGQFTVPTCPNTISVVSVPAPREIRSMAPMTKMTVWLLKAGLWREQIEPRSTLTLKSSSHPTNFSCWMVVISFSSPIVDKPWFVCPCEKELIFEGRTRFVGVAHCIPSGAVIVSSGPSELMWVFDGSVPLVSSTCSSHTVCASSFRAIKSIN